LGILEKKSNVKIDLFADLIQDTSQALREYSSLLKNVDKKRSKNIKMKIMDIFDLSIKTNNSKFTKSFIEENKGKIPVYSASKFENIVDYGYVQDNLPGIKYFENCLTWNIDGSIGKVYYRNGRFSLSEKVIPLLVKEELKGKFNLTFLKYALQNEFTKHSFGFGNKAGKGKIQNISILIPVNLQGEIDIFTQEEIANRYKMIEEIKLSIKQELNKISAIDVEIN
jgi:hypothetical protein